MSDYNPTYTVQWRDYKVARQMRENWRKDVEMRKQQGESPLEAAHNAGHVPPAPVITEVRPNPLSMELRIVLGYFWGMYNYTEWRIAEFRAAGVPVPPDLKVERQGYLDDVRNLCYNLFAPTSPHAPFHIHSEYGCDEGCPVWQQGFEAAKDNVLDWYTPDC